ncbi:MAG: hypothetical protein IPN74_20225 [Haliscomenobacter sp.]|nr:hypothetical protein [Haliscomenobacter sp.]
MKHEKNERLLKFKTTLDRLAAIEARLASLQADLSREKKKLENLQLGITQLQTKVSIYNPLKIFN